MMRSPPQKRKEIVPKVEAPVEDHGESLMGLIKKDQTDEQVNTKELSQALAPPKSLLAPPT
jgi:hypothetical protein